MTNDVKLILAATDFSRAAAVAVRRAAQLARATGARLELMHVVAKRPILGSWIPLLEALGIDPQRGPMDAMAELRKEATRIDAELALPVELHLTEGKAHIEIASRAGAINADLVIIGAHGEHFLRDIFVGATSLRVQRLSPVPVLVVRQAPFYQYMHVLIATDFSVSSAAAVRAAQRLFPDATFHVLHVCEVPFEGRLALAGVSEDALDRYRKQVASDAELELAQFVRETGLDRSRASRLVRLGYPPAGIKERATELDADLIVLGAQGKSRLEADLLGSVSERVVAESTCDVLLVRASA